MKSAGFTYRPVDNLKEMEIFMVFTTVLLCTTSCFGQLDGDFKPQESRYKTGSHDLDDAGKGMPKLDDHAETLLFLQKLFDKYGENNVMTFEGFEHLLQSLGIGKIKIVDHDIDAHRTNGSFVTFHSNHNHTKMKSDGKDLPKTDHDHDHDHHDHDSHEGHSKKGHDEHDHSHEDQGHDIDLRVHKGHDVDGEGHHHDHDHDDNEEGEGEDGNHGVVSKGTPYRAGKKGKHHGGKRQSVDEGHHRDRKGHSRSLVKGSDINAHKNHSDVITITSIPEPEDVGNQQNLSDVTPTKDPCIKEGKRKQRRKKGRKKDKINKNESVQPDSPTSAPNEGGASAGEGGASRLKRSLSKDDVEDFKHKRVSKRAVGGDGDHGDLHHDDDHHDEHTHETSAQTPLDKCMSARDILKAFHVQYEEGITPEKFLDLCPAMVYQIDRHACHGGQHAHNHDDHAHNKSLAVFNPGFTDPLVWGYALASVTVISLVGLLSVAMVPILQKAFFNHIIQFLVALAIGSLTGDAMLHLIPHALGGGESEDHGHAEEEGGHAHNQDAVWKGTVVLAGIYFFFLMERFMAAYQQWNVNRKKKVQLRRKSHKPRRQSWRFSAIGQKLSEYDKVAFSNEDVGNLSRKEAAFLEETLELKELDESRDIDDLERHKLHPNGHDHSHSHGHGHSHGGAEVIPSSIASIAWMVIMGDGLHNFSDGLAIGASFANSLTGGLSTSVAVFCHELPHELGDFAVLLRSGMSVKQALFYNIVSSVLCIFGMILGVIVGNVGSASLWIFAMTAGTFIYISLVDMLPEINTDGTTSAGSKFCIILLQVLGITLGVTIMLLIALYEDKIKVNID